MISKHIKISLTSKLSHFMDTPVILWVDTMPISNEAPPITVYKAKISPIPILEKFKQYVLEMLFQ